METNVPQNEEEETKEIEQQENQEQPKTTLNLKVDYQEQIKKAREAAVMEFKFAEEETLQKIEQEKQQKIEEEKQQKIEKEAAKVAMKVNNVKPPRPNSAKKNLKVKRDKQREDFEKQQQEANLEIDRLLMQNEDEFSMKVEIYNH